MTCDSADVLVIDDDADVRRLLRLILTTNGYTAYEAADGLTGLDRLRTHPGPLVTLLDWQLPRMDGLAVLNALAADADPTVVQRHAYILLTAHYDAPEVLTTTYPPSVPVTVMRKPFEVPALLAALEQAAQRVKH